MTITAMAHYEGKTEELKEVFHQLGLSLLTENELKRILMEVEVLGRAQVTEEYVLHTQVELDVFICEAEARRREAAKITWKQIEQLLYYRMKLRCIFKDVTNLN